MVVVPGKHILQLSLPPLEPNLRMSKVWVGGWGVAQAVPLWDSQGEDY